MLVVGLTGGAGSGKTSISRMFAEKGAYVVDADRIARNLVEPGTPVYHEIVRCFGEEILASNGAIDRKRLAGIVFCDGAKRALLNRIMHPRILDEIKARVEAIGHRDKRAIIIVDAPLLVELGFHGTMDKVIVVTATAEQQVKRLAGRDGMARDQAERILLSQLPLDEKILAADFIISNEGPLEQTARRVDELFEILKQIASEKGEEAVSRR